MALQLLGKVSTGFKSRDDIEFSSSHLLRDDEPSALDDNDEDIVDFRKEVAIVPTNRFNGTSELFQSVEFAMRVVDMLVMAYPAALKER